MFPVRGTDSLQDPFLELILAFLGRPAGRPVSAPHRSAQLHEGTAPPPEFYPASGPRLAASHSGPVGPARIPRSLYSTTVAALVSAPLRGRAAPQPGVSPARGPCLAASLLGPVGPARTPRSLSSFSASLYVRAGRSGPLLRPQTISCDHSRGGRVFLLVTTGEDVVLSWQATCWLGADGDGGTWSILSLPRMCSRCNTPIP